MKNKKILAFVLLALLAIAPAFGLARANIVHAFSNDRNENNNLNANNNRRGNLFNNSRTENSNNESWHSNINNNTNRNNNRFEGRDNDNRDRDRDRDRDDHYNNYNNGYYNYGYNSGNNLYYICNQLLSLGNISSYYAFGCATTYPYTGFSSSYPTYPFFR